MKTKTIIISFILINLILLCVSCKVKESGYPTDTDKEIFYINDIEIRIKQFSEIADGDSKIPIKYYFSPNRKSILIVLGQYSSKEVWFLTKKNAFQINEYFDHKSIINWHGNSIIEIMNGGMGYTTSVFLWGEKMQYEKVVENCIYIYPEKMITITEVNAKGKLKLIVGSLLKDSELASKSTELNYDDFRGRYVKKVYVKNNEFDIYLEDVHGKEHLIEIR